MKFIKFFVIALMGGAIAAGCGSTKHVVSMAGPQKMKLALDECQELAEAKPAIRAWGEGINFRLSAASEQAELVARSKFARAIETSIKTAQSSDALSYAKASTDSRQGAVARDEAEKWNSMSVAIAEQMVRNAVIIKTSQYQQIDGSYQVFHCLEYQEGVEKLAENVTREVQQRISDDERLKMNFEFEKFRKRVEEELKKTKAN